MLKVNPEVIKVYRQHLIKIIKDLVKPYLKDSEYRKDNGTSIKACFFKRQVKLKFLYVTGETVIGFTGNEVITNYANYGMFLKTTYLSHLCIEDLQILAKLKLDSLVKVEKPKRS